MFLPSKKNPRNFCNFLQHHGRTFRGPSWPYSCYFCDIYYYLQSRTKIVGTVNAEAFFSLPVLSFSLPMLFIAIQSANRVHQHWREENTQQRPNNFDWDCVLEEFWECDYSKGLLAGNHEGCIHMSSTVSRSRKKTFHGGIKSVHEIKCLYCIIRHILRFSGGNICNVGSVWGMPNSNHTVARSVTFIRGAKSTSSCSENALFSGHRVHTWYSHFLY